MRACLAGTRTAAPYATLSTFHLARSCANLQHALASYEHLSHATCHVSAALASPLRLACRVAAPLARSGPSPSPFAMSKAKHHSQDHEEARTPLQAVVLADSFTQARRARCRRCLAYALRAR